MHYTSSKRPDGYTFSKHKGFSFLHVGSGFVGSAQEASGHCECSEWQLSTRPLQHCYNILISTACHVVFNSEEARKTKLDFFYDEADSSGQMKSIWGLRLAAKLKNDDWCMICCATNDMDLACLLESHMENFNQSVSALHYPVKYGSNLCVVVSHPHGMSKKVTVGKMKDRHDLKYYDSCMFHYITPTCPGSSGAPVFIVRSLKYICQKFIGPHSEAVGEDASLNSHINKSGSCVRISEGKTSKPYRSIWKSFIEIELWPLCIYNTVQIITLQWFAHTT